LTGCTSLRMKAITKATAIIILVIILIGIGSGVTLYYMNTHKQQVPTTTRTSTPTSTTQPPTPRTTVSSTTTTSTSEMTTWPSKQIIVTDFRGKKIVFEKPVERIVVLESYWAETLLAIGAGKLIVGIGKWVKYDEYLPEYIRTKPAVGSLFTGVNVEEIAALKPDVVIMDIGYGKAGEITAKLEQMGIKVVGLFIHNFQDEIRAIKILGEITGHKSQAEELSNYLLSHYKEIMAIAETINNKLTAVMISGYSLVKGSIMLYSNTSWGHTVEEAGAINLALQHFPNEKWPKIDFETLASWNPDVILVTSSVDSINTVIQKIKSDPKWQALKAYKAGRIFIVPCWSSIGGVLDWGPRNIIGIEYIASLIYPNVYKNINWRADAEYLFTHFYHEFIPMQAFASYSINWMKVVDMMNETVTLPPKITRAVDFISYTLVLALHAMDKVVGISKYAKYNVLMLKAYPNVTKIPSPGSSFSVNIEDLLALKPQVVITWPFNKKVVEEIEAQNIPVIKVQCYSYKDIERLIWLFGVVFDERARAYQMISDMNKIVEMVQSKVSSLPVDKRVKVLYLWSKPTMVQGGRGTVNDFIVLAGGINVAAKDYPDKDYVTVDLEKIIEWNPQVIVIWYFARYGPKDILDNPAWKSIDAVKNGHVYKEPYYEHWGVSASIFILWLSTKLYPSLWSNTNFTEIANQYFKEWYGVTYTSLTG